MNRVKKQGRRLERSRRARKTMLCAMLALASVFACGVFALGSTPSAPTIETVAPRAPGLNARKIKRIIRGVTDQIVYVSYGPPTEPPLRCTPGHPFYVIDEGWVAAKDLRAGDRLSGTDGSPIPVRGVEVRAEHAETYNLEVEEDHTYFVSASPTAPAVWVHNDCKVLAEVEYVEKGHDLVAMSKPSTKERLIQKHRYTNPGAHDPRGGLNPERYDPVKSVLPENHVELFKKSVPVKDGKGRITRWTKEGTGKKAVYHRFQPHEDGTYHWNGSTAGVTKSGRPNTLELHEVPVEVQRSGP